MGDTFIAPLELAYTAPTITRVERPDITKPIAILEGVVGSFFLRRSHAKNATTIGVSSTTHPGFIDWYSSVLVRYTGCPSVGTRSGGRLRKYTFMPSAFTTLPLSSFIALYCSSYCATIAGAVFISST